MRNLAVIACLCLPTWGIAQDRFDAWVADQMGFAPFFSQSIGWEMPQNSVTVLDPLAQSTEGVDFVETPDSTAWVVGILDDASAARMSGLGLVWSDGFVDRAVSLGFAQTRSGFVAFQTDGQIWAGNMLPQTVLAQINTLTPGPALVEQPDGSVFPAGDLGLSGACLEMIALYKDDDALLGLVVLIQSSTRRDADATACAPLTT